MGEAPSPAAARTRAPVIEPRNAGGVFSQPLIPICTAFTVAILTMLAIRLGEAPDGTAVFWIANAVAAGAWLRSGKGRSFDFSFGGLMAVGVMTGQVLGGHRPGDAAVLTLINMIEVTTVVLLMRRFSPGLSIVSVRAALRTLMVLSLAAGLSGLFGGLFLHLIRGTPILTGWQLWSFGHALGLITVTPMMLSLDRKAMSTFQGPVRTAELIALLVLLSVAAYGLCFHVAAPVAFLVNPLLLVIAVRLRVNGLALGMLVVSLCMLGSLLYGQGPAATVGMPMASRIAMAQLMLVFACVPYLVVAALIEERDRLWAQARAGLARAERASEAKSRLLANVAHEIKSPVGGMIGIGELWSSGQLGPVAATQKEMAEMLVKTARQVETLAHDLLDVARAEARTVKVEARPTEIVGLVEDVRRTALLRPEARGVVMEVVSESPSLVAQADSQRLRQVIDNLAVNALKYGGGGGSVVFRVMNCALGVRIEVTDRGPGISIAKQAQLFEPFNRLGLERSSIEGHGVGLALARRLVELQGGEIGVISAPGEGATFWVEMPSV